MPPEGRGTMSMIVKKVAVKEEGGGGFAGAGQTFAARQPCVISARHHVAFQCIISAGKKPDMQNQPRLLVPSLLLRFFLSSFSHLFSFFVIRKQKSVSCCRYF